MGREDWVALCCQRKGWARLGCECMQSARDASGGAPERDGVDHDWSHGSRRHELFILPLCNGVIMPNLGTLEGVKLSPSSPCSNLSMLLCGLSQGPLRPVCGSVTGPRGLAES